MKKNLIKKVILTSVLLCVVFVAFSFVQNASANHDSYDYGYTYGYDCCDAGYYDYNYGYDYYNDYGYDCCEYDYYDYDDCCNYDPCCTYIPPVIEPPITIPPVQVEIYVSCYGNSNVVNVGQSVSWSAVASGGNGIFTYSWEGTDALTGSGPSIAHSYTNAGAKYASVTVTSAGKTKTASCGSVFVQQQTTPQLSGTCTVANYYNVRVGDSVLFTSSATGGTGTYTYAWSGTDGLSGSGASNTMTYPNPGTKTAEVRITSGNDSIVRQCGTITVVGTHVPPTQPPYIPPTTQNLSVSCSPNISYANTGQVVTWTSSVYGGNGQYNYYWSGTDGLSSNSSIATRQYSSPGTKFATLTVYSGNQNITQTCPSVFISSVASYIDNNVTLYQRPIAVSPQSSAVYLSQVPYTGIGPGLKLSLFLVALGLWSGYGAFWFVKRSAKKNFVAPLSPIKMIAPENPLEAKLESLARSHNLIISQDGMNSILERSDKDEVKAEGLLRTLIAKTSAEVSDDRLIGLTEEKISLFLA